MSKPSVNKLIGRAASGEVVMFEDMKRIIAAYWELQEHSATFLRLVMADDARLKVKLHDHTDWMSHECAVAMGNLRAVLAKHDKPGE